MPSQQDMLLGRIAIASRFVTREQLDHCISLQEKGVAKKPLGEILVDEGMLTRPQLDRLLASQREQRGSTPHTAAVKEREALFGRMAVQKGLLAPERLNECLRLQDRLAGQGRQENLGQLLVEKGYLSAAQVKAILAEQQKIIVTCKGCGTRFNAPSDKNLPHCPKCGGELTVPLRSASLPVVASLRADGATDSLIGREMGRCRVLEFVGRGSMGTVYKARHLALDKLVAIKALPLSQANRDMITRYVREARSLAKLEHKNIVHVYDVGSQEGICYIVMQFIQGRPLSALMQGVGVGPREALHIVREIARGLGAAHAKGIVHRDLKPDNVLVTAEKEVLIMDFGLAQDVEYEKEGEGRMMIVGTPYFIAPEQWQGGAVDGRADLYSLGVIYYTMLAGRRPFDALRIDELMRLHLQAPPPALRITDEITDGMRAVVEKLLAKDRRNRYQNASELMQDLALIEKGEDPLALGDFGPMVACEFCGALNPQSAKKCKVCKEELASDGEALELTPSENEFTCANCGFVQVKGTMKCGRCQVDICRACQQRVAAVKGLCAECLASGAGEPPKKGILRRMRRQG